MAKFKLDSSPGELAPATSELIKRPTVKIPEISPVFGKGPGDYLDELERLAQDRRPNGADGKGRGLILQPFEGLEGLTLPAVEPLLSPVERHLREAKSLIGKEQFEPALPHLGHALRESPRHPEALYLQAFCQFRLDRPEEALRSLLPLREVGIEGKLASRVKALQSEIRQAMTVQVVLTHLLLTRSGQHDEAVNRLRELVALDPEAGLYHYLLAGDLMVTERFPEALAAAEEGLRRCPKDERLREIQSQIERRDLASKLQPARRHYRERNYPKARSALQRVAPQYRESPLYTTFNQYLVALGGGLFGLRRGRSVYAVQPEGRPQDVEDLHFFLVDEDLGQAKALLRRGDLRGATQHVGVALGYAPHFPYANFLMALCSYQAIRLSLDSGVADLDEVLSQLETARFRAEIGAQDSEIEEAGPLLAAIGSALGQLTSFRDEMRARMEEVLRVNAAHDELRAILESAGGGIGSSAQLKQIQQRMADLRRSLPETRRAVKSPEGKQALKQLAEAVERHWKQLQTIEKQIEESDRIEGLAQELDAILQLAKKGVRSSSQLGEIRRRLDALRSDVQRARGTLRTDEARQVLDKLSQAVEGNWQEVEGLDASELDEAEPVNELMKEFQRLMGSVEGGIRTEKQLRQFSEGMKKLKSRVSTLRRQARSRNGTQALQNLSEAVDKVLAQLP